MLTLIPSADLDHFRMPWHGRLSGPSEKPENTDIECSVCTFVAGRFYEIDHKDSNHKNNAAENQAVVCPLCHNIKHLPIAAIIDSVMVAYVPELTQTQINLLCLSSWLAIDSCERCIVENQSLNKEGKDELRQIAIRSESIVRMFDQRCTLLAKLLSQKQSLDMLKACGYSTTDNAGFRANEQINAGLFANLLSRLAESEQDRYQKRHTLLGGVRFIPWKLHYASGADDGVGSPLSHWIDVHHACRPLNTWGNAACKDGADISSKFKGMLEYAQSKLKNIS